MKKYFCLFILSLLLAQPSFSQQDQFNSFSEVNIGGFAQPFVTSLGEGLNSGGFYTANIPKTLGFSISFRAMYIFIPNDQLTFTPNLPAGYTATEPTATFWGSNAAIYSGPNGYITNANGINQSGTPFAIPQITGSFMGTELLIRYLPKISVGNEDLNFFGIGVRHKISQYIPLIPVDLAVQFLYNKLTVSNLIDANSIAFNGEVSKTFGMLTAYGGLQYESTKFDLSYTLEGDATSGDPSLRQTRDIKASIDGKNNFRVIFGASVKLALVVLNVDYNLSSQSILTGGLSFEF
jgi:hypothetical protein